MKPLTVEHVKGQKREFTFLGWKDDGLSFYATGMDGQPAVITPVSAYPDDSSRGSPYRFPRIVPLEITPKRFNIAWTDSHREVLRRWRETTLAEVDAETQKTLFPFDALKDPRPSRTPAEIDRRRQEIKDVIESRYRELVETPLVELLDPIAFPYLLEDFRHGRWADALGKDFGVMMNEACGFNYRWHDAYNGQGDHRNYQSMLSALRSVRLVMRGSGNVEFPLVSVDVQPPTDREAQAYALMKQLMQGANTLLHHTIEAVAATPVQSEAGTRVELHSFKQVCKELGCKPTTLRNYCKELNIKPDAIKAADLAQIKKHRDNRKQRPHLKAFHCPRHGRTPKPRSKRRT